MFHLSPTSDKWMLEQCTDLYRYVKRNVDVFVSMFISQLGSSGAAAAAAAAALPAAAPMDRCTLGGVGSRNHPGFLKQLYIVINHNFFNNSVVLLSSHVPVLQLQNSVGYPADDLVLP